MRYNLLIQTKGKIAQSESHMHILDIFLPLSLAQTKIVESSKKISNSLGENTLKTELRIASLLLNNKNESAFNQTRSFNLLVKKFIPNLFADAKELTETARITKSENARNGKHFYYLSFSSLPDYAPDPWHGAISKADVLREAIIQCCR